jgi:sugar phosphate isomerase/epimerase
MACSVLERHPLSIFDCRLTNGRQPRLNLTSSIENRKSRHSITPALEGLSEGAQSRVLRARILYILQEVHALKQKTGFLSMQHMLEKIQVNVPFADLHDRYLPLFMERRINPEISFDALTLENAAQRDVVSTARQLHECHLKITLHGPFMDLAPGSPDPAVRAVTRRRFEQCLDMAALFKPRHLVCHAGYDKKRYLYMREIWIQNSLVMWRWLAERVSKIGGRLVLENVYEQGPDEMKALMEPLAPLGVGFCLDTGHQAAFGSSPLAEWVAAMAPFMVQLHLHDNTGVWDEHLPLGQGNIDFESFFKQLRKIREIAPVVTLEPHQERDLWPSLEYLEKIWPW